MIGWTFACTVLIIGWRAACKALMIGRVKMIGWTVACIALMIGWSLPQTALTIGWSLTCTALMIGWTLYKSAGQSFIRFWNFCKIKNSTRWLLVSAEWKNMKYSNHRLLSCGNKRTSGRELQERTPSIRLLVLSYWPMNKVCLMITTSKTLADITWHPAHSPSDDTHKVMSSRTGELLHKGGIHLRHTRIAVAYVHVVKWSSVFKTSKVTLPNNLFQMKRNLACEYIRLSSLLAAWVTLLERPSSAPQRQK